MAISMKNTTDSTFGKWLKKGFCLSLVVVFTVFTTWTLCLAEETWYWDGQKKVAGEPPAELLKTQTPPGYYSHGHGHPHQHPHERGTHHHHPHKHPHYPGPAHHHATEEPANQGASPGQGGGK